MIINDQEIIEAIFRVEINKGVSIDLNDLKTKESKNAQILLKSYYQSNNKSKFKDLVLKKAWECYYLSGEFFLSLADIDSLISCISEKKEKTLLFNKKDAYWLVSRTHYLLKIKKFEHATLEDLRKVLYFLLEFFPPKYNYGGNENAQIRFLLKETIRLLDEKNLELVEEELDGGFYLEDIKLIQEKIGKFKLGETPHPKGLPVGKSAFSGVGHLRN